MTSLTGRAVLVTGASGGLGPAVVDAFLEAGARVSAVARSWRGADSGNPDLRRITADLSTNSGCESAMAETKGAFGALDTLVHVIGGFAGGRPIEQTTDEDWNSMFEINAASAFRVFRAAVPDLRASGRGRLIAIGAKAGAEPSTGLSAYSASKGALHALVQVVAAEAGNSGVTANVILPSTIDTEANRKAMPGADRSKWVRPEQIASLAVWLCSEAAGAVNGALIPVYGGS